MCERFRTGDTVRVPSLDEEWFVASCEGGWVTCGGYPETMVPVDKCELVRRCDDAEHLKALGEVAQSSGPRGAYARRKLAEAEAAR